MILRTRRVLVKFSKKKKWESEKKKGWGFSTLCSYVEEEGENMEMEDK